MPGTRLACLLYPLYCCRNCSAVEFFCLVPTADPCGAAKFTHSITSSAIASTLGGMITASALAVLTLIVSSYLVGCCTDNSATFAPLRIRSTYDAPRLYKSAKFGP